LLGTLLRLLPATRQTRAVSVEQRFAPTAACPTRFLRTRSRSGTDGDAAASQPGRIRYAQVRGTCSGRLCDRRLRLQRHGSGPWSDRAGIWASHGNGDRAEGAEGVQHSSSSRLGAGRPQAMDRLLRQGGATTARHRRTCTTSAAPAMSSSASGASDGLSTRREVMAAVPRLTVEARLPRPVARACAGCGWRRSA
jgi:hypothetical protein